MPSLLARAISNLAPLFLVFSPVISYADQIAAIHRTRTSAGFSLDIPLIMLTASILKIFYWPGARYDSALLIQAVVMVVVQVLLLKVALTHRPGWRGEGPFKGLDGERPFGFWRWRSERPYWEYLGLLTLALLALHTWFQPTADAAYTQFIGGLGLAIEAILPIPQIISNQQARSCKGFRFSVLATWLMGDAMKIAFFFLAGEGKVPWAFKMCGLFQAACDVGLGIQYYMYGDGSSPGLSNGKIEK